MLECSRILRLGTRFWRKGSPLTALGLARDTGIGDGDMNWERMRLAGKPHLPFPAAPGGLAVALRRLRRRWRWRSPAPESRASPWARSHSGTWGARWGRCLWRKHGGRERAVSFTEVAGHGTSFPLALDKNSAIATAPINLLQVRLDSHQFLAFREPFLWRAAPVYKLSTSCIASQPRITFWFRTQGKHT